MASNFKLPIVEPAPVAKPVKVLGKRVVVSVNEHIGGPGPAREHPGPVKADGLRQIKSTTQEKDSTDTPPTEKRTTEMEANTERMVKGRRTKRPEAERSKGNRQKAKGKTPSPGVKEQLLERKERKQQTQQLKHQEQKPRASQRIARQPTTTRRLPSTKGRTILADSPTSSAAKSENMTEAGDQHHLHQTDNAERNHDGNSDAPRVPLSSEHSYNNTPMAITSLQAYNNTPTAIASLQALLNEKNGIIESLLNRVHHLEEQVSQLKEKLSHYDGQDQANDSVLLLGTECHRNVNVSGGGEDASGKLRFLATDGLEDVKPVLPSSVAEGLGHSSTHDDTLAAETGLVDHIIANSVLPKTESHVVNVKPELVETESDSHHRLEDDILGGVVTMATDDVLMESIQEDERTGICSDDQSDPSTRANPCIEEEEAEIKYEEDPTFTTVDGLRVIQITPGEYSSADDTEGDFNTSADQLSNPSCLYGDPVTTDDNIGRLSEESVPLNSRKNMNWVLNAFYCWRAARNTLMEGKEPSDILPIVPFESMTTDQYLSIIPKFLMETKKRTGKDYPANTLYQMVASMQALLRMKGRRLCFLQDPTFKVIQDALEVRMKKATASGAGLRKQVDVVSPNQEAMLWSSGTLGTKEPKQLLHTVMYLIGKHFALRSSDHKALNYQEQLTICQDEYSHEFLLYEASTSKPFSKRPPRAARAYANLQDPEKCPVAIFKQYLERCPTVRRPKSLYLHATSSGATKGRVWFGRRPVGIHYIQEFMQKIMKSIGQEGRFTPHSLRPTAATNHRGVPAQQLIQELTGGRASTAVPCHKRGTASAKHMEVSTLPQAPDRDSADDFVDPPRRALKRENKYPTTPDTISSKHIETTNAGDKRTMPPGPSTCHMPGGNPFAFERTFMEIGQDDLDSDNEVSSVTSTSVCDNDHEPVPKHIKLDIKHESECDGGT